MGFPGGAVVKNPPAKTGDARDVGSIPGSGRSPGGGTGNSLQYSCLKNSMDRGAWRATAHGVTKTQSWLNEHSKCNIINIYMISYISKIFTDMTILIIQS